MEATEAGNNKDEGQKDFARDYYHRNIMLFLNKLGHSEINSSIQTNNIIQPMRITLKNIMLSN